MKIAKNVVYLTSLIILTVILAACSSPEEKAADFVSKAGTLFEEGELAKAEIEYKNALQINKNLPDALFGLAKIKESKQEWRRVYALLMKVRELDPGHIDGRIMLTHLMLASNQLDEALIDATEILEMAPGDARSHSLMAAVQYRLENFEGALQEVAKALEIDPVNRDAILVRSRVLITQKKYNEAISILDAASKSDPTNASFQLMKIQAYQETSDKRAIEKVYLELVDQFPESDAYRNALLYQYVKDERIDDAERIMEQIIQANPNSIQEKVRFVRFKNQFRSLDDAITLVKGYINTSKGEYRYRFLLGELYENNKQIDQALKVYRSIVTDDQLQRNGLEARNKIALIELRAGNRDKAIALVKEVLAQDKNNENGLLLMARMDVADQRFEDAILNLRTALRDNPESIGALGLLGQSYDALGSSELALETYARAFKLSPGTPEVANQLARHLIRDGKLDRANEALQESVAKGNDSIDAMKILVQVKLSQNEWDEAERLAKQLQKIEGQEALSQQVLGVVYQRKKLEDASIDAFKRAHELAPTAAQPIVSLVQTYEFGNFRR
jgi:tetratricopeptide (TPR) repeat protein